MRARWGAWPTWRLPLHVPVAVLFSLLILGVGTAISLYHFGETRHLLDAAQAALFRGITWSTDAVMAQTRERAKEAGVRWREFETLWDLDVPADLDRWRAWQGERSAPTTAPILPVSA